MTTRNQAEHVKTVLLVVLVLISFVFSGYLWYSTPASETLKPDNDVPPYIFKGSFHKERHELIAPSQILIHQAHHTSMLLPEESHSYRSVVNAIQRLDVGKFSEINPPQATWAALSVKPGVEFRFLRDISYEMIEAFFGSAIFYGGNVTTMDKISRIRVFSDPSSDKVRIWLISEERQKIAEAYAPLDNRSVEKILLTGKDPDTHTVVPLTLHGSFPWEKTNKSFPRVFYLPTSSFTMKQLIFHAENINIDNMKQWLFQDPEIRPLIPNTDESFYMFNDQLLNFNSRYNYMAYSDSSSTQNEKTLYNQVDQIKNFMQRHQGWTGLYLLDTMQKDNLYLFRLFKQGLPVFWSDTDAIHTVHPDLIQLQPGDADISKYIRSMYYLSKNPSRSRTMQLPSKESLLAVLTQRRIPPTLVEGIFPGYVTEETTIDGKKQIHLNPRWVIQKTDGKREFVS